jgi:hypothetical protein
MASVTFVIQTTSIVVPGGTVGGPFRVSVTNKANGAVLSADGAGLTVTIASVPAGDYSTSAFRVDANTGATIGTPITGRDIAASEFATNVDVPASIVVTLAP